METRTDRVDAGPQEPLAWRIPPERRERLGSPPPMPHVLAQILQVVTDDGASASDAARIVSSDASLAARVLQVVNSPSFGVRRSVSSLTQAIAFLGFSALRTFVLAVCVYESLVRARPAGSFDRACFWQHCLAVALAAKELASAAGDSAPEEAYVAGLLHDVGKVLLDSDSAYAGVVKAMVDGVAAASAEEDERFGTDHAEVGGWAAAAWGLPRILVEAIRNHHAVRSPSSHRGAQLASIVRSADVLCWSLGYGPLGATAVPLWAAEGDFLVPERVAARAAAAVERELDLMCGVFSIPRADPAALRRSLRRSLAALGRAHRSHGEERSALATHAKHLEALVDGMKLVHWAESDEERSRALFLAAQRTAGASGAVYVAIDPPGGAGRVTLDTSTGRMEGRDLAADDPLLLACSRHGVPFVFSAPEPDSDGARLFRALNAAEGIAVPVLSGDACVGLLVLGVARVPIESRARILERLAVLAGEATRSIDASRRLSQARELAGTDELTGLRNRRSFLEALAMEGERVRRCGRALSLALCDLDHFKPVNDVFGHQAGDRILRDIAALLRGAVRSIDLVGRYGGDEFILLLPETDADQALVCLERVRGRVEGYGRDLAEKSLPGTRVTLSAGIAQETGSLRSREELLGRVDRALYAAKECGRNHVCVHRG